MSGLLLKDFQKYKQIILAARKGDYGRAIEEQFSIVVHIRIPLDIRMKRLHDRSFQLFGYRMLNGRDLYEQEKKFFKKVESKTEEDVKVWLANMRVPVIEVDGLLNVSSNVDYIIKEIKEENDNV